MLNELEMFDFTLVHFFAAAFCANPILMYGTTEWFARDSNPTTAPQMVQQSGALFITPFRLPFFTSR